MKIFKNRKGVTLAEMMAVVVIMGIIAAIAVPLAGSMIDRAKEKAVEGDAQSLYLAATNYCITEDCTTDPTFSDVSAYLTKALDTTYTTVTIDASGNSGKINSVTLVATDPAGTMVYDGTDATFTPAP